MKSAASVLLLLATFSKSQSIWQPAVGTTWQITLSTDLNDTQIPNIQAYDFDVYDNPASTVSSVHEHGGKVICYFSAGTWENWRPDKNEFKKKDIGKPVSGWKGERWLDVRSNSVRKIMQQRMDLGKKKGCDAIDPDNIDAYDNGGGGFDLTSKDAVDYVQFLASEGHKRGMSVGLKNGLAIIPTVLSDVDFAVNEQCLQYNECDKSRPFIGAGKPVFHIEYVKGTPTQSKVNSICSDKSAQGFSTLIKHLDLAYWYIACPSNSTAKPNTANPKTTSSPQKTPKPVVQGGGSEKVGLSNSSLGLVAISFVLASLAGFLIVL